MELELSRHRDHMDWSSPAVDPLDFPIPTISKSQTMRIMARDHRTGEENVVKALLRQETYTSTKNVSAYLLKKVISKSEGCREKIWAAVVLEPVLNDTSSSSGGRKSPFSVQWETTTRIVTIRVCSWATQNRLQKQKMMQEASALQFAGSCNQHVQGCLEILKDDIRLYIVMPRCLEGSLASHIKPDGKVTSPIDEGNARKCFKQLCMGLLHLQQKGLYHGNVCLEQLFYSDEQIMVLSDLDMSLRVPFSDPFNEGYIIPQGTTRRLVRNQGSRSDVRYQAPEMGAVGFDAFASDLWAAGVVLFEMLTGVAPFKKANASDVIFKAVAAGNLQETVELLGISISHEVCELLQSIFRRRPSDRATLSQIMEHPWLLGKAGSQSDESDPRALTHELPPFYSSHEMELLKKDITRKRKDQKSCFDLVTRKSLRKEWMLRTRGNAKQVSFGRIEILSSSSIGSKSYPVQVDQHEQYCTDVPRSQSLVEKNVISTEQAARRRSAGTPWKKLFRSTKKKVQNVVWCRNHARVNIDSGGPSLVTARSA